VDRDLIVQATALDGVALVILSGELDIDTAPRLRDVVDGCLRGGARGIEIDMSDVAFCGCEGLNVLLSLRDRAVADGIGLRVLAPGPQPCRLFQLTGTAETLGLVHPSTSVAG
jgi:anti-sigma B factor antagonist